MDCAVVVIEMNDVVILRRAEDAIHNINVRFTLRVRDHFCDNLEILSLHSRDSLVIKHILVIGFCQNQKNSCTRVLSLTKDQSSQQLQHVFLAFWLASSLFVSQVAAMHSHIEYCWSTHNDESPEIFLCHIVGV